MKTEKNKQRRNPGVAKLIPDKIDFKTKAEIRENKESSNSASGYLSEETQNTKLKRHVCPYNHCSIIYNS